MGFLEVLPQSLLRKKQGSGEMGKASYFPWVRPGLKFAESLKTSLRESCFQSIREGGQEEFQRTAVVWKVPVEKPETRVTGGWVLWPRPLVDFPVGTRDCCRGLWLTHNDWNMPSEHLFQQKVSPACVTGPGPSPLMATEQVAFSRASTGPRILQRNLLHTPSLLSLLLTSQDPSLS